MQSLLLLAALATVVAGGQSFSQSCTNINLSATGVLTATCDDKSQRPKAASLDLNTVIGVSSNPTALAFHYKYAGPPAGFEPPCTDCVLETKPDPIYLGPTKWLHCLCGGAVEELNLDDGVGNDDGVLTT